MPAGKRAAAHTKDPDELFNDYSELVDAGFSEEQAFALLLGQCCACSAPANTKAGKTAGKTAEEPAAQPAKGSGQAMPPQQAGKKE